jgi:hypothetical protein
MLQSGGMRKQIPGFTLVRSSRDHCCWIQLNKSSPKINDTRFIQSSEFLPTALFITVPRPDCSVMFKKRTRTAHSREKVDLTTPPAADNDSPAEEAEEQPT